MCTKYVVISSFHPSVLVKLQFCGKICDCIDTNVLTVLCISASGLTLASSQAYTWLLLHFPPQRGGEEDNTGKKIRELRYVESHRWLKMGKQSTENHSLPPHRQTNALSVSEQLLPWKLKKKNEIVLLLPQFFLQSITVYTMEYSFGQSWSAVMAVCLPKLMPTPYRTKHHTACYDES